MKTIKSLENDKIVIIYDDELTMTPLFCELCEFPMKTIDDNIAFRKSGVCHNCDMRWSNTKGINLNNKIFPTKTTEEWQEYINVRLLIGKTILNYR